ncbi:hypothetical protein BASA81_003161 [Batrachochytrium salamandrivorans]|nr:hypothetical protein BASA81_003161 [Batrachochytrium salamandrivorans]
MKLPTDENAMILASSWDRAIPHTKQLPYAKLLSALVQKMLPFVLLALLLANLAAAKRLAGEGYHFLVLQHDGQVFAGGFGFHGQLGLNTTTTAVPLPQPMLSVTNATDVSTGTHHSCILDQGKRIKCTGYNYDYQLGDGTTTNRRMLAPVLGLTSGIEEVYCGHHGSCTRMASGKAQCWGLFAGLTKASPITITISGGIQSISVGDIHACFVAVGGKLYCMGNNAYGQLGTGNIASQTAPTPVVGLAAKNIVSVACGYRHTCAVNANGAMFCWGKDFYGQLGDSSVTSNSFVPVQVLGITHGAASARTGLHNSFALMQNGTVVAFGADWYGVFGAGSVGNKSVPIVFGQGVSGVVEIRGGYFATCVLLQNDAVWCTGSNYYGQLGVGNDVDSRTLVEMKLPKTPTKAPTAKPTKPTKRPTKAPTRKPTKAPTATPTKRPTNAPTQEPTKTPTNAPTNAPTTRPTKTPTKAPTKRPTKAPTARPTKKATLAPTKRPSKTPTAKPTKKATLAPTKKATLAPTKKATLAPTS